LIFSDPENDGGIILRGKTPKVQLRKRMNLTFLPLGEGSLSPLQGPVVIAVWRNRSLLLQPCLLETIYYTPTNALLYCNSLKSLQ